MNTHGHLERGRHRDRALLSSAGAAVLSRLAMSATSVLSLAVAARSLSHAELGVLSVLTALTVFLGFGDFGLGTLLMTRLPAAQARSDAEESTLIVTVTMSVLLRIALAIVVIGAVTTVLLPWGRLLGAQNLPPGELRNAVICFFASGALAVPAGVGARVLVAMQRASITHAWNAAAGVVALALTGLCAELNAPLWSYVAALAAAPAVLSAIQTSWVFTKWFPQLRPHTLSAPWALSRSYLGAASLFAIMSLSAVIAYAIDSLVVASVMGAVAAAVFAIAVRMFGLVGSTLSIAGQQLWSALADAMARGDSAWVHSRYRRTLIITGAINAAACTILIFIGRDLARLWVGRDLQPPMSLLVVLAVWTVVATASTQATYLLAAVEKVRVIALAGVVMAPVNLVLSIVLTKHYGLSGPIWGSLIAQVAIMVAPVWVLTTRELRALDRHSLDNPPPLPELEASVA